MEKCRKIYPIIIINSHFICSAGVHCKNPKNLYTRKIDVIILKLEYYRFTTEYLVQMQTEWKM